MWPASGQLLISNCQIIFFTFQNCLILKASGISTTHIRPKSKFYLFPVGLEKSIVSKKMQKERKKKGKRGKKMGKRRKLDVVRVHRR